MALSGTRTQQFRHALLVGSNPAVVRVVQTYLHREGVGTTLLASGEVIASVVRADLFIAKSGHRFDPSVALLFVPASPTRDQLVARFRDLDIPVVLVTSGSEPVPTGQPKAETVTLFWPFRLREMMDAIDAAMVVAVLPIVRTANVPRPTSVRPRRPDRALADTPSSARETVGFAGT